MSSRTRSLIFALVVIAIGLASPLLGQQKGQWVPGQFGLNAGVIPDPGVTYANLALNYSASQLNGPNGNSIQHIAGTYSFWVDENIFYYIPKHKFLGGYFMPYIALNYASGDLVADIPVLPGANLDAGGSGFADTYVQPVNLGWHLKRADVNVGYAFTAELLSDAGYATSLCGKWHLGDTEGRLPSDQGFASPSTRTSNRARSLRGIQNPERALELCGICCFLVTRK